MSPYLMLRLNGLLQSFTFGLQIFELLSCLQKFFSHFSQLLVRNLVVIIEILYWNRQHFLRLEQISDCQLGDSENFQQFRRHFGNNLDEFLRRITESQTYTMGWYPIWSWRIYFCKFRFSKKTTKKITKSSAWFDNYLTAVFFETGAMLTPTKSQNGTNCGSGGLFQSYLTHS